MIKKAGLTRIDAIVAAASIVFLLVNIPVIMAGGRGNAKREVCMANLRELTAAWDMFTGDNAGKIPSGDVGYSWQFPSSAGGPQGAWIEYPSNPPHSTFFINNPTEAQWKDSIADGLLWKYIQDYKVYKCPVGNRNECVTYSMSHSMNTYPNSGGSNPPCPMITLKSQISKPAERFVFMDTGVAKQGAFFVKYSGTNIARWYDPPPMRHGQGTTFSFADGHAIYRKWTDPHTLAAARGSWGGGPDDNCDCDLRWMVKVTWGNILYNCTNPNKNCEY